jgi:hypothetical protein
MATPLKGADGRCRFLPAHSPNSRTRNPLIALAFAKTKSGVFDSIGPARKRWDGKSSTSLGLINPFVELQ